MKKKLNKKNNVIQMQKDENKEPEFKFPFDDRLHQALADYEPDIHSAGFYVANHVVSSPSSFIVFTDEQIKLLSAAGDLQLAASIAIKNRLESKGWKQNGDGEWIEPKAKEA